MLRQLGRTVLVCAFTAACSGEPIAPPEPPPSPKVQPTSVIGATVTDLGTTAWLQGSAEVGGTQLVVFWELWCPHCRREVPKLQALSETLGPKGLEIVGLTRLTKGVTADDALAFAQGEGVAYPLGVGSGALARQLKVSGIPAAAVLVDGNVVWRGHPNALTEAELLGWL